MVHVEELVRIPFLQGLSFEKLFKQVNYRNEGLENLPDQPGHIFIMNHLDNHPDNQLPNDFRLTLDTHFVFSMILYPKYKDAPIRLIRKSNPDEYGHQRYYDRLGYIYIYAGHVDDDEGDPEQVAEQRRRHFLGACRSCLVHGQNIVICPEGACTTTEKSPLPFKAGAFRLASYVEPEPLIVPIAVAHFEKKVTRSVPSAVIHEPVRLSDHLEDPENDEALFAFVNDYQKQFAGYVREAERLGG